MKIINRAMRSEVFITKLSEYSLYCQASFNSDGAITLRNYDIEDKDSDEIIIMSAEETQAIIKLFSQLGKMIKNNELPF